MLSRVEDEKSFIAWGPGVNLQYSNSVRTLARLHKCTESPEYTGRQSDDYNNSLALAQLSHLVTSVDES